MCRRVALFDLCLKIFLEVLEVGAVNTTALIATEFVSQGELECAVVVAGRFQSRNVDVVAEPKRELVVVKTGRKDECIRQHTTLHLVGDTNPSSEMDSLVVAEIATATAQDEFKAGTRVHLEGRPLFHNDNAWNNAKAWSNFKFTAGVNRKTAVQIVVLLIVERLVGTVQVVVCTTGIEIIVLIEHGEPEQARGSICKQELVLVEIILFQRWQAWVMGANATVLCTPFQFREVKAALGKASLSTNYQVVRFFPAASHALAIGERQFARCGCKIALTSLVAPESATNAEVIIASDGYLLVIADVVGRISIALQHTCPLVAVVGSQADVTVHQARHGGVEVERRKVELGKMDVLRIGSDTSSEEKDKK